MIANNFKLVSEEGNRKLSLSDIS